MAAVIKLQLDHGITRHKCATFAEAEMLEMEAAAAADQPLVDQAGDESDDLDMDE